MYLLAPMQALDAERTIERWLSGNKTEEGRKHLARERQHMREMLHQRPGEMSEEWARIIEEGSDDEFAEFLLMQHRAGWYDTTSSGEVGDKEVEWDETGETGTEETVSEEGEEEGEASGEEGSSDSSGSIIDRLQAHEELRLREATQFVAGLGRHHQQQHQPPHPPPPPQHQQGQQQQVQQQNMHRDLRWVEGQESSGSSYESPDTEPYHPAQQQCQPAVPVRPPHQQQQQRRQPGR